MGAIWYDADYRNANDVDFHVWDYCPGAGKPIPSEVEAQTDYDIRAHLILKGSQVAGHCLQVQVLGYTVQPAGVTVYITDWYQSGTAD